MSQVQGERRDIAFDGRIQLDGANAPELEVLVEIGDQYLILGHSSGELGRWEKHAVQVAPIGRGWFTIDVEDEQVSFLPRRPGYFAAATLDMVPVDEEKKTRSERRAEKKQAARAAKASRRETKKLRRREGETPAEAPAEAPAAAPVEPVPADRPFPVEEPPTPQAAPAAPVELPLPIEPPPGEEPASPWDDLPVPEVPRRVPRGEKAERTPARTSRPARERAPKPSRQRTPRPAREKPPRPPRKKPVETAGPSDRQRSAEPDRKRGLDRAFAAFWHGFKGFALRISDELRQTGIVPFDRLPAAPARSRPTEDHTHAFEEHRLPGGLIRNVCHECGLVSIGESDGKG